MRRGKGKREDKRTSNGNLREEAEEGEKRSEKKETKELEAET
jgi:hypothetical protein